MPIRGEEIESMKFSLTKTLISTVATGLLLLGSYAGTARAEQFVSSGWTESVHASGTVTFGCSNSPGPWITLENGQITVGSLGAEITLSNNKKLTHTHTIDDVEVDVNLVLDNGGLPIPKQPSRTAVGYDPGSTGVGDNPYIYVQFYKQDGATKLSDPILLGRCVQGGGAFDVALLEDVLASAKVSVDDPGFCSNNPGPNILLQDATLLLSGISAKIIFTNNAKFTHVTKGDGTVSLDIILPGGSVTVPKQPPLGGAGGNPLIYFIFKDNQGNFVGIWPGTLLGRCNKL